MGTSPWTHLHHGCHEAQRWCQMLLQTGEFPPAEVVLTDFNISENQTSEATGVQFSCSVMSDSLQSHGLQHNRLHCPPSTPRTCSNSVHQVSDAIQPSHPLLPLLLLPSIFLSIRVFSSESVLRIKWPKHWSFSFSISPSNEYSRLISFRMDWFDLPEVQGALRSLLQHHSSKASMLWPSVFFMVQLSHPYVTTGKTIALTRCTFASKVMSYLCVPAELIWWLPNWLLPGPLCISPCPHPAPPGSQWSQLSHPRPLGCTLHCSSLSPPSASYRDIPFALSAQLP